MALTNQELENALTGLPSATAEKVRAIIADPSFNGQLSGILPEEAESLLTLAAAFSVAPISGFHVGAIALGQSGRLYLGANLEFARLPLNATLHAEQSAVLNAWMHEENEIVALYVSETPCGYCRQFLRELSNVDALKVHTQGEVYSLNTLLPHAFGETRAKGCGLLDSGSVQLESVEPQPSTSMQHAINAAQQRRLKRVAPESTSIQRAISVAQRSYTPYTHSPEGFVIRCINGQVFSGCAAESAAFNPSVPGALVALNQRNLSASREVAVSLCIQAKLPAAMNNPLPFARAVLGSVSKSDIEVVQMEVR